MKIHAGTVINYVSLNKDETEELIDVLTAFNRTDWINELQKLLISGPVQITTLED